MENFLFDILIFIIPGVLLFANGIRLLRGGSKGWYFSLNIYAGGMCYSQIPMGLAILSSYLGIIFQLPCVR